jgi:predicted secreted protein
MAVPINSIQAFKQNFGGGSRANRFEIVNDATMWPSGISVNSNEYYKFYSSSLPRTEVGTVYVGYRGRTLSLAGDRSYTVWNISIYDDNNTTDNLWQAFHRWKEKLDGHYNHKVDTSGSGTNNYASYKHLQKNWRINQLQINGDKPIRTIKLVNCWPSQIGGINLDMSSPNQGNFSVTMTFDWFEIE